jgi:hypothetical protein
MFNPLPALGGAFGISGSKGLPKPPIFGMLGTPKPFGMLGDYAGLNGSQDDTDQELPPVNSDTPMSYAPVYTADSEQANGTGSGDQASLPKPPPAVRSNNPFGKENLGQTLLGIGSAFLSSPDFFSGLGAAGQAVSSRKDALRQQARWPIRDYNEPGRLPCDPRGPRVRRLQPGGTGSQDGARPEGAGGWPFAPDGVDLASAP